MNSTTHRSIQQKQGVSNEGLSKNRVLSRGVREAEHYHCAGSMESMISSLAFRSASNTLNMEVGNI